MRYGAGIELIPSTPVLPHSSLRVSLYLSWEALDCRSWQADIRKSSIILSKHSKIIRLQQPQGLHRTLHVLSPNTGLQTLHVIHTKPTHQTTPRHCHITSPPTAHKDYTRATTCHAHRHWGLHPKTLHALPAATLGTTPRFSAIHTTTPNTLGTTARHYSHHTSPNTLGTTPRHCLIPANTH